MNEAHDRAPPGVPRPLTTREREALIALVERGKPSDGAEITADDRKRWLEQVPSTHAGARCRCGTCPSIDLTDEAGTTADGDDRVVLEASAEGAMLLLFIDDGRLSYLELAPLDDDVSFAEFPEPSTFTF